MEIGRIKIRELRCQIKLDLFLRQIYQLFLDCSWSQEIISGHQSSNNHELADVLT